MIAKTSLRAAAVTLVALVAAVTQSCSEFSAPVGHSGDRYAAFAVNPVFQAGGAAGIVQFDKVRIVVRRADGTVALDTLVGFPASASELQLALSVPLSPTASASGEDFSITIEMLDAAGVVVFQGGPVTVRATNGAPLPPVQVPTRYTGPGADAVRIEVSPASVVVEPGGTATFTGKAFDGSGNELPGAPVLWSSASSAVASFAVPAVGTATAGQARGTTTVTGTLVTGQSASASFTVRPPARAIAIHGGNGQTGPVGLPLGQPLVAIVTAADGLGVEGVHVSFAVASGGGAVSAASAVTNANGLASTNLTLGASPGITRVVATAAVPGGASVEFTASAVPGSASQLVFTSGPTGIAALAPMPAMVVEARDSFGNRATGFSGTISLALENPPAPEPAGGKVPGGAIVALGGNTSVAAVGGVATFTGVTVSAPATGLRLRASAVGVAGTALSNPFNVTNPPATHLVITRQPVATKTLLLNRVTLEARNALGAIDANYSGALIAFVQNGPNGGRLIAGERTAFSGGVAATDVAVNLPGNYQLGFVATGLPQVSSNTFGVVSSQPVVVEIVSGNGQSATAGALLGEMLVVRVLDGANDPVNGATVQWQVITGGGLVNPTTVVTGADGLAKTGWSLGAAGAQVVHAKVEELPPAVFSATATGVLGTGRIAGIAVHALGSTPLPNVVVELRSGTNVTTGTPLATQTTISDGVFVFSGLAAGQYTIVARHANFIDGVVNLSVTSGETTNTVVAISPNLSAGQVRIVLTWGAAPADLDAHLLLPNGTRIYYGNRGNCVAAPFVCLDVDDTDGFGPETITIVQVDPGTYTFKVHNWSGFPALSTSNARVDVYIGSALARSFTVPNAAGSVWTVFTLSGTTVTPVNVMNNALDPLEAGGIRAAARVGKAP